MNDVKPNASQPGDPGASEPQGGELVEPAAPAAPTEPAAGADAKGGESTPPAAPATTPPAAPAQPPAQTVPYARFKQVNEAYKKTRRELANLRGQGYLDQHGGGRPAPSQGQGDNLEAIRNHPYVQDLEMSKAEGELKRGAEKMLSNYPQLPKGIKNAILKNPRGFIQPATEDVQNGLLDIEDYVQEVVATLEGGKTDSDQPKQVPVAGTNTPAATQGGTTPADIQAILNKPPAEWTKEEAAKLEEYGAPKLN